MKEITVIVPMPFYKDEAPVLESLRKTDCRNYVKEVIIAIGKWPPSQRNQAVLESGGRIIYFFNKDAQVSHEIFAKARDIFKRNENIAGVGGPDLTPRDNSYLQSLFGYAMSSYFAHWKMRSRYLSIGKERVCNEREVVLSNLAIRKDIYLKAGGLDKRLYPNEENELINRISNMGYEFIYSPDLKIYRDRRKTFPGFARQFYRYGYGRMNQIFVEGLFKNLIFLVPLFFLIYMVSLLFLPWNLISLAGLAIYLAIAGIDSIFISFKNKKNLFPALTPIYFTMHLSYGLGMLGAIIKKRAINDHKEDIIIKRIDI